MIEKLCKQYVSIDDNFDGTKNYDLEVGSDTTADDYEIYYVKEPRDNIDIRENVYYYESGALEKLHELIVETINDSHKISIVSHDDTITDQIDWEDIAGEVESQSDNEDFIKALNVIIEQEESE